MFLHPTKPIKSQALGAQLPQEVGQAPANRGYESLQQGVRPLDPLPHLTPQADAADQRPETGCSSLCCFPGHKILKLSLQGS